MVETWDWTKLSSYSCETRGKYAMERHLQPLEPSEALAFGIGFHKAVEVWTQTQDVEAGKKAFVEVWEKELPFEVREKLEVEGDRRSIRNFNTLFDAFILKFPLAMYDEIPAVEQYFRLPLGTTESGVEIEWCGVIDRIARWQGGLFYVDLKTHTYSIDDRFFSQFRLSGQLIGYAWAGEKLGYGKLEGIMVQGVQVQVPQQGVKLKKDGTPYKQQGRQLEDMFGVDIIPVSDYLLNKWKQKVLLKIEQIHQAQKKGHTMDLGDLCHLYNKPCPYRILCESPEDLIEPRVEQFFRVREWNPADRR